MTNEFNAETFAASIRLAGNAWRNADGKGDNAARVMLSALVTDALSPMAVALSIYDEMEPLTAKGKKAEPKESATAPGGVSVSSLRAAKGGEGARSCLEAVFYVLDNRDYDAPAVSDFIAGKAGAFRLFPLKAHLAKAKMEAAKEAKEAATAETDTPKEGVDAPAAPTGEPSLSERIVALAAELESANPADIADALETLRKAVADAASRLDAIDKLALAA